MVSGKRTPCQTRPSDVSPAQLSDKHQGGPATGDAAAAATHQLEQQVSYLILCASF